ncbi:regulatory protein RecX [Patescibacteria group bacterium]|nr:regulatory protein RecX [Patescibacteria group bacterium]
MASCKDYALKYIHHYPKTEQELKVKLLTKHYDEDEVDETMAWLKKMNRVDDKQFTRLYFQSESVKKGKPPYLVKQKLLQKGVDKKLVEKIFGELESEIDEGIIERIKKEVEKLKKKGLDGFDIVTKISQK